MAHYHAIVWIDHREARIFRFGRDGVEPAVVRAHVAGGHAHRDGHAGPGHGTGSHSFLSAVASALTGSQAILIVGPADARAELFSHLQAHAPAVASHVVAVESSDHPSDAELVAHARTYFKLDHQEEGRSGSRDRD